jgi:hypothetical protein
MRGDIEGSSSLSFSIIHKKGVGDMVTTTIQEVIVVGGGVWEYQDGGPPQFDGYVCV